MSGLDASSRFSRIPFLPTGPPRVAIHGNVSIESQWLSAKSAVPRDSYSIPCTIHRQRNRR